MNFVDVRYSFDDPAEHGLEGSLRTSPPQTDRMRSHLLASGIKITPALFPDLARGLQALGESMMLDEEIDCFVTADPHIQAYCVPHQSAESERFTVVLSSALVERLKPEKIRFVIGHEIGHFLCRHWQYPSEEEHMSMGDRLSVLRLMRAAEISADRIGMLACRSLDSACAAMIKVAAGLGEPILRPDIPSILSQFRDLARGDGVASAIWTTHPVIPLRVRALLRFDPIFRKMRDNDPTFKNDLIRLDKFVEADFNKSSGRALQKIADKQLEQVRVWGLVALFAADGVISKTEQDLMVESLDAEKTAKILRFLKSNTGNVLHAVEKRLAKACQAIGSVPPGRAAKTYRRLPRHDRRHRPQRSENLQNFPPNQRPSRSLTNVTQASRV